MSKHQYLKIYKKLILVHILTYCLLWLKYFMWSMKVNQM
uniref:Uncharacterized protein n=1 Tax=Anguilla anguilla TaxID=7936 RepID=A0A0E9RMW9_ANGAN